ncbi:hypothetical protein [Dyadobacter luteus]|jgi:hypothetical protein|uniref:hypothetical protein n=1 Tax=Dyadobacter luteus TaxID=2259619 RepID=UPI0018F6A382|nr:hypothetical protein [Dyadobacter luteus]
MKIITFPLQLKSKFNNALVLLLNLLFFTAFGQSSSTPAPSAYPRTAAYQGVLHPIVTLDKDAIQPNFKDYYVVGFPIGINLWKTQKLGFSVEMVPLIRAQGATSRVANVIFHPGVLVNLGHNFTFAGRMAFETSGRYGITPVISKIVRKGPTNSYFVAVPVPVRFGNNHPASLTAGFQFGIIF